MHTHNCQGLELGGGLGLGVGLQPVGKLWELAFWGVLPSPGPAE